MPTGPVFLPALRARMGDWTYYVTTMLMSQVAEWVKRTDEVHVNESLSTWIQRRLTNRSEEIAQYLRQQPQHLFGAIICGVYDGEPDWYPVELRRSAANPDAEEKAAKANPRDLLAKDERLMAATGYLKLRGDEKIFAIDGQHRVEAIKMAVKDDPALRSEEQCVLFVSHQASANGRERTRRLFSTLNRYAKPVSLGEIVALDEDDAFAITTRRLVEDYAPLRDGVIHFGKTVRVPTDDERCITSILALYKMVEAISVSRDPMIRRRMKRHRLPDEALDALFLQQRDFWDELRGASPEVADVLSGLPGDKRAGKYRHATGGHLLFRPVGQEPFAQAYRTMIDRGVKSKTALKLLLSGPLELSRPPWTGVLWEEIRNRVINKNKPLAKNLILYCAGQEVDPPSFQLHEAYKKVTQQRLQSRSRLLARAH